MREIRKQLDLFREIIVDNFAGGGGASNGIELATGLNVDIAINHDPAAIAMHKANHPDTEHYCESVWDINPSEVVKGRKVGLCWLSPDCKHFSKAKGGKPVDKTIRGLAWVAVNWAIKVQPRVIMLENVEEFKTWGPLKQNATGDFMPDPDKKGMTFLSFKKSLEVLGYKVETKELKACDYGAPTTRKRLFLIARCDGHPITWPEPTYGAPDELNVQLGLKKPYFTAGEIIDWSIPAPTIFGRKKPLVENTMKRIAKGLQKFVIENPNPYVVDNEKAPYIIQYHSETTQNGVRGQTLDNPLLTIDTQPRYGLVTAFISKNYAGQSRSVASDLNDPLHTITARQCHSLVEVKLANEKSADVEEFLSKYYGKTVFGDRKADSAFLVKYYGQGIGQGIDEPLHTIPTKDRFGLVTVAGEQYRITDIGMRMLQPHELFKAQGFPDDYIIDRDHKGNKYPKTQQVARCGNSVPPVFAEALVRANLPEMCVKPYEYKVAR